MVVLTFPQLFDTALTAGKSRTYSSRSIGTNRQLNNQQRLAKWFTTLSPKEKAKIIKDVSQLVLARRTRMCNFLEYKGLSISQSKFACLSTHHLSDTDSKIVYRRYASLFFIAGCASTDNELITLEIVHRYVEQMDKYYGNVCELVFDRQCRLHKHIANSGHRRTSYSTFKRPTSY